MGSIFEIKQITDKQEWEDFVKNHVYTLFVQSWNHGEFYKNLGEDFWIFGVYKRGVLVGGSLVLSTHAKRGDYLYLPYGPIIKDKNKTEILEILMSHIQKFAAKNNYDFIRVSPFNTDNKENSKQFKKLGFKKAPIHALAENTWLLDLEPTEEELLSNMKKNHRNLIRRCIKKGVKIEVSDDKKDLQEFNKILDETAKRHNFYRFPNEYVEKEFNTFVKDKQTKIFKAYLPDGRLDSIAIFMFYGNMAVYRHSGSLGLNKKLPTSYLIQWEVIKQAKKQGMHWYNFWGVAPDNAPKDHPFKGITHFKKGFGGFQKDLLPCHDLPITAKYWFNWIIETIRKKKRGF
jgi:lipid II:glycine glycyltransferase (peptidoglycan interpeptide bridge formation enzyme)